MSAATGTKSMTSALDAARKAWPKCDGTASDPIDNFAPCPIRPCALHRVFAAALEEAYDDGWRDALNRAARLAVCECGPEWTLRRHHRPECFSELADDIRALKRREEKP